MIKNSSKTIAYLTLLVYWSPSNALHYFWGFLLLFFILLFKPEWVKKSGVFSRKIIKYVLIFFCLFCISFLINYFKYDYSANNFIWSLLTYGSSLFILVALLLVPFKEQDIKGIFVFCLYLTLFQVFLGYFQMLETSSFQYVNPFASGNNNIGDNFIGTIFKLGLGGFIAIKISLIFILFLPYWFAKKNRKNTIILLLLLIGWILPSAIFTLIIGMFVIFMFYIVGNIVKSFYTYKIKSSVFYSIIIGSVLISGFFIIQRENVGYLTQSIIETYGTIIGKGTVLPTRKVIYYRRTLIELPKERPHILLTGLGPGNYSSRSAWLVSGKYLEHQPDYISVTPTDIASEYNLSLWTKDHFTPDFKGAGSIIHQPFSSWVSVFAEVGILGLLLFFLIFSTFYKGFNYAIKIYKKNKEIYNLLLGMKISLVYLLCLFFMENLFEYPIVMGQFFVFACAVIKITEKRMKDNKRRILSQQLE